jgi:hypothetical protein
MEFVHPGLLAGGLFAALPVVLHLIMRPRPKPIEFPALRFVQARQSSNRRTLQLRHLLLLALRMGAIALLAFALSRPTAKLFGMFGSEEAPVSAVFVFDTSPRMGYMSERKSRLDAAREFAGELMSALPPKSEIAVIDTSTAERVFEADPAIARQRVAKLKLGGRGEPLAATCDGAADLIKQGSHPRKELYVFSDLSVGAWSGSRTGDWARRAVEAGVARVQVIDVGVDKPENFALGNVALSEQTPARGRPLTVTCSLSALGSGGRRLVRLRMIDPATGKLVEQGMQEVTLGADETRELTFGVGGRPLGTHQGEIRIDEPDNLPDDNARFFTVFVRPPDRLLVVAPSPAAARAKYFTEAIAPRELVVNGLAPYELTTVDYTDFAKQEIDQFAAVVLLDPPPLPDALWQNLEAYIRAGRGAAVILGPGAKPDAFNGDAAQSVLAGKLPKIGGLARYPNGDLYLWPDADQHPLLVDFKPLKNSTPWDASPVYCYWKLTPGDATTLVAVYNNDEPAIVERSIGTGRALTMTTPISEPSGLNPDDRWNLLPDSTINWPFVVLVNGITSYLVGRDFPFNYLTAEVAQLRLDPAKRFETYLVTRRDAQETLRLPADLRRNVLTVPINDRPGNYRAQAGGTTDGVDRGFSVNYPADVDSIRRLEEGRLAAIFAEAPYAVSRRFSELKRESNPDRRGRELFPWLICAVAVALGLEQVLADRFYRDRRKS